MNNLGTLSVKMEGASSGAIDLAASGIYPTSLSLSVDFRSNSSYDAYFTLSNAETTLPGTALASACTGAAFANQPANDSVTATSNSASDVGKIVYCWGTTNGTNQVVAGKAVIVAINTAADFTTLDGTAKADWGNMLGFEISSAAVGTITMKEKSGGATIKTIAASGTATGVTDVASASQRAESLPFRAVGSGATTKVVGVVGVDEAGNTVADVLTLSGTTVVLGNLAFKRVTKLLYGDLESSVTATFAVGALSQKAASFMLSDGDNAFEPWADRKRYLHWCFYNGTTATAAGANDAFKVTLYG